MKLIIWVQKVCLDRDIRDRSLEIEGDLGTGSIRIEEDPEVCRR